MSSPAVVPASSSLPDVAHGRVPSPQAAIGSGRRSGTQQPAKYVRGIMSGLVEKLK